MKIAILGGTGKLGRRLAEGWRRTGHQIVVGTRDPARPRGDLDAAIALATYADAAEGADLVVLSVPAERAAALVTEVAHRLAPTAVLLSVMIPLRPADPTALDLPAEGSTAALVAAHAPAHVSVTAGFHTVAAGEVHAGGDVLICGQTPAARALIVGLARELGLQPVDCGPLRAAETLERLTPLLIGINRRYKVRGAGIHISGVPPDAPAG